MCLNIGTAKNHHFPFGTNGKVVVLGVLILKHSRYFHVSKKSYRVDFDKIHTDR